MMMDELVAVMPDLYRWAKKNSGLHYDQDDLVSDTIIHFLQRPDRWDPSRGSLKKFLFSCVRNRSSDALRTYHRKGRERLRRYLRYEVPLYVRTADDRGSALDIKGHIDSLPKKLAEPFRLFAVEGKTCREIAECLGIREGYVRCLLWRARATLRKLLAAA